MKRIAVFIFALAIINSAFAVDTTITTTNITVDDVVVTNDVNSTEFYQNGNKVLDTTYSHLSNFTDDLGISSDWDEIGDVPTNTPTSGDTANLSTSGQIYSYIASLNYKTLAEIVSSIGNWTADKSSYYLKTEIDSIGEVESIYGVDIIINSETTNWDKDSTNDITTSNIADQNVNSSTYWSGISSISELNDTHTHDSTNISIHKLSGSTYDDLQDYINTVQSSGLISGGNITDNGDGTVTVLAGTGFAKTTDSDIGETVFFDWSTNSSVNVSNAGSVNYIRVDYNGGTPVIDYVSSLDDVSWTDQFAIGIVYKEDTNLSILEIGSRRANIAHLIAIRDYELREFERASGLVLGETGTRYATMTAGRMYALYEPINIDAIDTSGTDRITYWYSDGSTGWTEVSGQTQYNNANYDDGDGVLGNLVVNQYGVLWAYVSFDGELNLIYGTDSYSLTEATDATVPSSVPDFVDKFCIIIGKVIIQQGATSTTSIETAFEKYFQTSVPTEHNSLNNLQGGTTNEYYHFTSAQHSELIDWIDDTVLGSSGALTLPTGQSFTIGTTQWNTGDLIDGEQIYDDTIDDDSLDFGSGTNQIDSDDVPEGSVNLYQLTEEEVEDYVGGMVTGNTETLVTVTYQDDDGTIDFVVNNDLHSYSWTNVVDSDIPDAITVTGYMQDTDIDTFTELNAWITDATLLKSGGTITNTYLCRYDGSGIDCDVVPYSAGTGLILSTSEFSVNMTYINDTIDARDSDTTYTASGTLLDLTGTAFSVNEGTLTNGKGCKFVTGTGIVCDQDYLTASPFGASIDDTEMTAEDFGEFTCTGLEDGCTINNDALDDQYYDSESDLTTLLDDNYQPLEATLTDIADGTIAEDLINTANPWADNEVADDLTISSSKNITSTAGITLNDNVCIWLGTGDDICMYYNGSAMITSTDCSSCS